MTMTNVPAGASDAYYVYRPLLDLIGFTEGTDKKRGYNETLAYGAYTGNVNLVGMTLTQIDALQTKMLANPKNKLNSSALGRYQIVRTTLRSMRKTLGLASTALFDADMQDRLACYLLGVRGIDKYLAGRLSEDTLINNLAHEWASLPQTNGMGAYGGQNAAVKPARVRAALAGVKARHDGTQPQVIKEVPVEVKVPVPVDTPVVPEKIDHEVKKKTSLWGWLTTILGSGGAGLAGILGADWQTVIAIGGLAIVMLVIVILLRRQIIGAVQDIRGAVEG
jgi:muramidase (phage lysozyme)